MNISAFNLTKNLNESNIFVVLVIDFYLLRSTRIFNKDKDKPIT